MVVTIIDALADWQKRRYPFFAPVIVTSSGEREKGMRGHRFDVHFYSLWQNESALWQFFSINKNRSISACTLQYHSWQRTCLASFARLDSQSLSNDQKSIMDFLDSFMTFISQKSKNRQSRASNSSDDAVQIRSILHRARLNKRTLSELNLSL